MPRSKVRERVTAENSLTFAVGMCQVSTQRKMPSLLSSCPHSAYVPSQCFANVLQDLWCGFIQGRRFRQYLGDEVLSEQEVLVSLYLSYVAASRIKKLSVCWRGCCPENPSEGTVLGSTAVPEAHCFISLKNLGGLRDRRLPVVRMDEVDPGLGEQFLFCVAENICPRFVHPFEISVEAGHADQVKGKIEQLCDFSVGGSGLNGECADMFALRG